MDIITTAKAIAERAHATQVRKTDGSPYIKHPEAVAAMLEEYGFSDVVVAAGWVHDVLEDTEMTAEMLV
ncbi:MAG: HD domain-containing protein, partial [Bacteroidota bacterium]